MKIQRPYLEECSFHIEGHNMEKKKTGSFQIVRTEIKLELGKVFSGGLVVHDAT